jgi:MATE family multidrug resistance protein
MIAQAIGARQRRSVRRTVRQGLWMAVAVGLVISLILMHGETLMLAFGQSARTASLAGDYLGFAAWMMMPSLMFVVLRALVSAHGSTRIILRITLAGIVLNAALDYTLMFGAFGLPRLEMQGAGIATASVHLAMFLLLLGHVVRVRPYRRYLILVRLWKPDWARFAAIWRLGAPIGVTMAAESGLFAVAAVMMGWLGEAELAAHAVALQFASIAFMTPLGLSHATTVRVGLAHGSGDRSAAARAGWVSIMLSLVFMGAVAALFVAAPRALTTLLLDPADPANARPLMLASQYLMVAALFQLVDGAQVTGVASLRGLGDTRVPMLIALVGYWVVGIPFGWVMAFPLGFEGVGLWLGLAAGLAFAAVFLCARFARLTAPGQALPMPEAPQHTP